MLRLKVAQAVFQVQGFMIIKLFTTSMDYSSADYRSFKQMFFDLAIITTSVSAKGENKASDIIPYVLKPFSWEQLFNGFFCSQQEMYIYSTESNNDDKEKKMFPTLVSLHDFEDGFVKFHLQSLTKQIKRYIYYFCVEHNESMKRDKMTSSDDIALCLPR